MMSRNRTPRVPKLAGYSQATLCLTAACLAGGALQLGIRPDSVLVCLFPLGLIVLGAEMLRVMFVADWARRNQRSSAREAQMERERLHLLARLDAFNERQLQEHDQR
jgi:hypothetical protein